MKIGLKSDFTIKKKDVPKEFMMVDEYDTPYSVQDLKNHQIC